ncbi:autotransporter assembly complex protein TamA [Methyloversatilis thermotolerans]|uniref:autotransporter assembly complex protein TamA n=1 Tax=Methyloversatilis thermotolerans TaxID=1346290 RepID=UPI000375D0A4|nr:BamA/TamA family outer membrane protein [Methyloversatilis thermotolerans]
MRRLLCGAAIALLHLFPVLAAAADDQTAQAVGAEVESPDGDDADEAPARDFGRLELVAPDLPSDVLAMLNRHVRSLMLREAVDSERAQRRAVRRVRREAAELLATEGYFSPAFEWVDEPPGVRITPGPRAQVTSVQFRYDGELAGEDETHAQRRAELEQSWRLHAGQPFRQADWSSAKQALLDTLTSRDYAAGALVDSRAEVDPDTAAVDLSLHLDSGPAFRFGDIEATGLALHDLDLVKRYSTIRRGDRYSSDALLAFERALLSSPYFSSVQISTDTDPAHADAAPVKVSVTEAASRRLSFGAGLSSNTGYRGEVGWSDNNIFGKSWLLSSAIRLEQLRQIAFADVMLPPQEDGYRDSFGVLAENADIQDLITRRVATSVVRARLRGDTEIRHSLTLQKEEREIDDVVTGTQQSLALNTSWTWRRVDDLFNPRTGWVVNAQIGGGVKALLSDANFLRGYLKAQWFIPVGQRDQIILRGEVGLTGGAIGAIPQDFLFRTGGSTTVRGYDYLELGVREGSAIVGGRALGVASIEYVHWNTPQWGGAVFVDAGDAASSREDFKPAVGYGAGVRWRSPAGPIAFDIAYGERERQWRPHFSLSIAF